MDQETTTVARKWGLCAPAGLLCLFCAALGARPTAADCDGSTIRGPQLDRQRGTWQYQVESPFLSGSNLVEVLLPERLEKGSKHRVLYVLPVEAGANTRYGDGLMEVKRLGAHNKYGLICVAMQFDTVPWYGAHESNPRIRHEQYLKQVVVPLIEGRYPTRGDREGRLLLGFSKSGWGALTLIFRSGDFFGYAASWDAPLMLTREHFGTYETGRHFGTPENFARYLPSVLMAEHAREFQQRPRLVLSGSASFGDQPGGQFKQSPHTAAAHQRMEELGIKHVYDNSLAKTHRWDSGWVEPVLELLMKLATDHWPLTTGH